jgi:hypothetical protein
MRQRRKRRKTAQFEEIRHASEFPVHVPITHAPAGAIKIDLAEDDFWPLAAKSIVRRFTHPNYNVLPPADLRQILALSPSKACLIWNVHQDLLDRESQCLSSSLFQHIDETTTADDPDEVRRWLTARLTPDEVIVSWLRPDAVLTTSSIFCRYWDDFCYPSSDDVTIWSVHDHWAALYHHSERMYFGICRD